MPGAAEQKAWAHRPTEQLAPLPRRSYWSATVGTWTRGRLEHLWCLLTQQPQGFLFPPPQVHGIASGRCGSHLPLESSLLSFTVWGFSKAITLSFLIHEMEMTMVLL